MSSPTEAPSPKWRRPIEQQADNGAPHLCSNLRRWSAPVPAALHVPNNDDVGHRHRSRRCHLRRGSAPGDVLPVHAVDGAGPCATATTSSGSSIEPAPAGSGSGAPPQEAWIWAVAAPPLLRSRSRRSRLLHSQRSRRARLLHCHLPRSRPPSPPAVSSAGPPLRPQDFLRHLSSTMLFCVPDGVGPKMGSLNGSSVGG